LMSWLSWSISQAGLLYMLLKLSKSTMKALRETLADSKAFIAQIRIVHEEKDDKHYHQTSKFSCITFTPEYMQIKEKHYKSLYYTEYIGSSEVSHIQVKPESALSIGHAWTRPLYYKSISIECNSDYHLRL